MILRFKISCCACKCSFELGSDKFRKRDQLECPNCKQHFPDKEFDQISKVMAMIQAISEDCAISSIEKGFKISAESFESENDEAILF